MANHKVTNKIILEMMNNRFDRMDSSFDKHCEVMEIRVSKLETSFGRFKDRATLIFSIVTTGLTTAATVGYDYLKTKVFNNGK